MKPQTSWNDNLDDTIAMPFNRITQPYTSLINPNRPQILGSRVPNILGVHPQRNDCIDPVACLCFKIFFRTRAFALEDPSTGTSQHWYPMVTHVLIVTHFAVSV